MSMSNNLALLVTIFGILLFLFSLKMSHSISQALPLALEFWTAAGLLRLSHDSSWHSLLVAATIIAIRKMVMLSLRSRSLS
jgi:hypothetical protein